MILQFITKQKKLAKGFFFTYIIKKGSSYNDREFWDSSFYVDGVSDSKTLSPIKSSLSSQYHYSSVELIILRTVFNNKIDLEGKSLIDLGSGSGHWIQFYHSVGVKYITGIDVSKTSIDFLRKKYSNESTLVFHHGKALECLRKIDTTVDFVNAIGVMFHIVDDTEWRETIQMISERLNKGGIFIVGGHFGHINGLNVQFDKHNKINKRLRSKYNWIKTLKKSGFSKVNIISNPAYLHINDTMPENNIIIATK